MPKCENCYHYEACNYFLEKENKHLGSCEGFVCKHFKDKSLISELPCRVGDTLYVIIDESEKFGRAYIKQEKVVEVSTEGRIWTSDCYYDSDDVGRMIFFNRDEAEKAFVPCAKSTEIPESFKNQLYDKFTHGKG